MDHGHDTNINEIMAQLPAIYCRGKCVKILPHYPTGEDVFIPEVHEHDYVISIGAIAISYSLLEILRELDIPPNEIKGRSSARVGHSFGECGFGSDYCKVNPVRAVTHGSNLGTHASRTRDNKQETYPFSGGTLIICETPETTEEVEEFLRWKYPSYDILTIRQTSYWGSINLCPEEFFRADVVIITQSLISRPDSQKSNIPHPRYAKWETNSFDFPIPKGPASLSKMLLSTKWDTIVQLYTSLKYESSASYRNLVVIKDPPNVDGQELSALVLGVAGNGYYNSQKIYVDESHSGPVTTLNKIDKILSEMPFSRKLIHRCGARRQLLKSARSAISNQ